MSAYDITEFLRTAYQPFAYCVPSNPPPLNTAYQKGGVTLIAGSFNIDVRNKALVLASSQS